MDNSKYQAGKDDFNTDWIHCDVVEGTEIYRADNKTI